MILSIRLRLFASFILALVLSILPLPSFMSAFRPPWILLLVLYIEYFVSERFNLITLLLLGLLLDVLLSSVIGEHSFALVLIAWLASTKSRRFQWFSMMQQLVLIGFFCLSYQLLISFIDALLGFHYNWYTPFASAFIGVLLWPWIRLLGEDLLLYHLAYR